MTDNIKEFLQKSSEFHTAVAEIMTQPDPVFLREQAEIRSDFKLDLKKVYNGIKNSIVDLEKINRRLGEEMTRQGLDIKSLDSQKLTLYYERKHSNA